MRALCDGVRFLETGPEKIPESQLLLKSAAARIIIVLFPEPAEPKTTSAEGPSKVKRCWISFRRESAQSRCASRCEKIEFQSGLLPSKKSFLIGGRWSGGLTKRNAEKNSRSELWSLAAT